jgi:hypothetical protein
MMLMSMFDVLWVKLRVSELELEDVELMERARRCQFQVQCKR